MTIDEAIKELKNYSYLTNSEELQIAEWLEELKIYQQHEIICNKGYNAGYNKAIDDLLGGMNQITYNCQDADELFEKICDLAEQLKAGGENERSI